MPVKVTTQVLLGWKSHGCPAVYAAAVGETWVANKPGGLNVRNGDDLEIPSARSLFVRADSGKPTHQRDLGKADGVGEVTGKSTLPSDGIMAQASWERLAE